MQVMLTSFGIADAAEEHLNLSEEGSLFYHMPPVNMHTVSNAFMPDYIVLLLCDKVIIDKSSFVSLEENPHRSFTQVADAITQLHHEGFVKLVDFRQILKRNENLLQKMLEHDLQMLDQWIKPLRISLDIWKRFANESSILVKYELEEMHGPLDHDVHRYTHSGYHTDTYLHLLEKSLESYRKQKRSKYRGVLMKVLPHYLSYVNANIVLSNELGVGFHDWADFLPFYRHKFISVGKQDIGEECQIKETQKLFEVSFPEFAITDTRTLIKVLKDKRIADLRELVDSAVKGEVTFDQEFAKSVLKEVIGIERQTNRYRNIVSYVTMPIGFVPWLGTVAQKVTEETVGTSLERRLKQKYRWFYLLSDLVEKPKGRNAKK